MSDYGVKAADIPQLAEKVLKIQRILANNPRKIELPEALAIYRNAL